MAKDGLAREADEAKALLDDRTAQLEAERQRAEEEGEARRRLESMLAAERKKEEEMVRVSKESEKMRMQNFYLLKTGGCVCVCVCVSRKRAWT